MRYLIPLFFFLLIVGFLWKGLQHDPHQLPSALINKPLPVFSYPDLLDFEKTLTQKEFLGHVHLLNIWATWCLTCYAEHQVLMEIARTKTVAIYGLNYKDDLAAAREWLKKYGNPYKATIADERAMLAIDLGAYGTPETFVIDGNGIIRYRYVGPITLDVWQNTIEPEVKKWRESSV